MQNGARYAGRDIIDVGGNNNTVITGSPAGEHSDPPRPAPQQPSSGGVVESRRIFVAVDAMGYSKSVASQHSHLQRDLRETIAEAAMNAGLPYDRWIEQPQGDGVLAMAPLDQE